MTTATDERFNVLWYEILAVNRDTEWEGTGINEMRKMAKREAIRQIVSEAETMEELKAAILLMFDGRHDDRLIR